MQSPQASGLARFGGLLLLLSLILPYFVLSFAGFAGKTFHLHELDRTAVFLIGGVGLVALAQPRLTARQTMALIYLIAAGLFFAALSYRLWIAPPDSKNLGDLLGGLGELSVDGQQIEFGDVTIGDMLGAIGASFKPTWGAWVATIGGALFVVGSFLEFREAGSGPAATAAPVAQQQYRPPASAHEPPASPYQQPTGQPYATQPNVAPPPTAPPDPFAPPGAAGQPAAPAVPTAPPAQPPPGPSGPQRPPGS